MDYNKKQIDEFSRKEVFNNIAKHNAIYIASLYASAGQCNRPGEVIDVNPVFQELKKDG